MILAYKLYLGALVLVCLLAVVRRQADLRALWTYFLEIDPMRRTALVLASFASINAAFVTMAGIPDPWAWYIVADGAAAALVLTQPAGKHQSVIGGLYMAQIVVHCVYGVLKLAGDSPHRDDYWQVLIAVAFAQLVCLGAWTIDHYRGRLARHRGLRTGSAVAGKAGGKGVAR